MNNIDYSEMTWNAVFGPFETKDSVLSEAANQNTSPQDFTMSAIIDAVTAGADLDKSEAFYNLCKQLDVPAM